MHVVTVAQNKGGEGKTTVARLLADWAARLGLRVLVMDMDPQCNLSQRYLVMDVDANEPDGALPPLHPDFEPDDPDWDGRSSIVDLYNSRPVWPYRTANSQIDIIPGYGRDMRKLELQRAEDVKEKIHDRLRIWLADPEIHELYDLVICDTPPAKSPLVISALRAATHLLIPCQMEQQSLEGLRGMTQLWRRENRALDANNQVELIGILPNKFRPVALQLGILDLLQNDAVNSKLMIPHLLSQRTVFAETDHPDAKPKSVFDLPPSDKARQEAIAACTYIFAKAGIVAPATPKVRVA